MSQYNNLLKNASRKGLNKNELIEMFVGYYGEQHRAIIEKRIKEIKIAFYVENEAELIVANAIEKKYKSNPEVNWKDKLSELMQVLHNITDHKTLDIQTGDITKNGIEILLRESNIIKELGLDIKKIITKNQNGEYELVNGEETRKLQNYMRGLDKSTDSSTAVYNEDSIKNMVTIYNYSVAAKKLYSDKTMYVSAIDGQVTFDGEPITEKDFAGKEFPQITKELTKEDCVFLNDLIMLKTSPKDINSNFAQYLIHGANRLFNQNYQTLEEVFANMELLLELTNKAKKDLESKLATDNSLNSALEYNKSQNIINTNEDKRSKNSMLRIQLHNFAETNPIAEYQSVEHSGVDMVVMRPDNIDIGVILHEFNHGLSANTFNEIGGRKSGFDKDSKGFNEIVNEFLTVKVMDKYEGKTTDFNSEEFIMSRQYRSGITFFEKFLNKFENKLIECQMGDARKCLVDFIGESNYTYLMEVGKVMADTSYGKLFLDENGNIADNGKIYTAKDFVDAYKNGKIDQYTNDNILVEYIQLVLECDKFLEDLVANYAEFEKGNIVEITPQGFDLSNAGNVYQEESGLEQ